MKHTGKTLYLSQILLVCGYHFSRWYRNKRVLLTFLLGGIMTFLLTEKIVNFSMDHNTVLQIIEPFIWTFDEKESILLAALIIILLFADMPLTYDGIPYVLVRVSRKVWMLGQICYLAAATVIYIVYIAIMSGVLCSVNAYVGNRWSDTAALLGYSDYNQIMNIPVNIKICELTRPYKCAFVIVGFVILYVLLSVLIMMVITLKFGKKVGVFAILLFHLSGIILDIDFLSNVLHLNELTKYKGYLIMAWTSPLNHMTFHMHNFGYDMLPTLKQSLLVYGVFYFIVILILLLEIKNYNFSFARMEEQV